ncbi:MAG TPA: urease accessory protein UreD [Trebonia sp.]
MPANTPAPGSRARNQVTASAQIIAESGPGGTTRLPLLRSQVPLVLRRAPEAVYLVSAAAAPLGGDCLNLRIEVRAGATLCLRTVAASVALPGLDGGESLLSVTATVAAGGRLEYLPEPVVVADGARHATDIRVSVAEGGSLVLRDELILGRHGERGGAYRGSLRADYAGRPLLRQALDISGTDPVTGGPAILSGHRAVGTLLQVDPALHQVDSGRRAGPAPHADPGPRTPARSSADPWVTVMPLATGPATLVTALAHDAVTLRKSLAIHQR